MKLGSLDFDVQDSAREDINKCAGKGGWTRLAWAYIKCNVYLFLKGMWRGECEMRMYDAADHVVMLVTVTGSAPEYKLHRIFYARDSGPG